MDSMNNTSPSPVSAPQSGGMPSNNMKPSPISADSAVPAASSPSVEPVAPAVPVDNVRPTGLVGATKPGGTPLVSDAATRLQPDLPTTLVNSVGELGNNIETSANGEGSRVPADNLQVSSSANNEGTNTMPNIDKPVQGTSMSPQPGLTTALDGANLGGLNSNNMTSNPFMSSTEENVPNVSFAESDGQTVTNSSESATVVKKKTNKTALIVLSVIAFIVAVGLAVILVLEVMGIGPFSGISNSQPQSQSGDVVDSDGSSSGGSNGDSTSGNLGNTGDDSESDNILIDSSIVCTATQTDEAGNAQDVTMTLHFTENKFTGASASARTSTSDGGYATYETEFGVDDFLNMAGTTREQMIAQGAQFDDQGNLIVTRGEVMQALSGMEEYTCITSDRM